MYIQDMFNPNQKKKLKGNKLVDNSKNLNIVQIVGFGDLVGTDIAPVSKKTAVKRSDWDLTVPPTRNLNINWVEYRRIRIEYNFFDYFITYLFTANKTENQNGLIKST